MALAHGFFYAAIATFIVLGVPLETYLPLTRVIREELLSMSVIDEDSTGWSDRIVIRNAADAHCNTESIHWHSLCIIVSVRREHIGRLDTYVSCALVAVNFLFTIPYLVVAAYGTRSTWEGFRKMFLI